MTSNRPYLLRAIYEWICDNGLTPYVLVDATRPGIEVPVQSVKDGKVVLNLAPRAVSRLDLGKERVSFLARFSGVSHAVSFPVSAVVAIYAQENGQGMMFPAEEGTPGAAPGPEPEPPAPPPKGAPKLRVIK
ncbi:ClpXP protease specificity-enhancing factor [Mizugakiibacter sediminis]|nr:ClpXP protease specificity-enhancing factor [Mizugakiibacter sediminis]